MRPTLADLVLTERLRLRRPASADLDVLFEVHADPEASRFNRSDPPRSLEESLAVLESWLEHWRVHGFGPWVAEEISAPPGGPVIGFGGLRWRGAREPPGLNLYFWFRPSAWGHGYATELARAAIRFAFVELGADEVSAIINPENQPSIRVAERAGMTLVASIEYRSFPALFYVARRVAT